MKKNWKRLNIFFYYCEYSKAFWIAAENWITSAQSVNISFSVQNVLLGFGEQRNDVLTLITVLIKQQLFICRCNNRLPVFEEEKKSLLT